MQTGRSCPSVRRRSSRVLLRCVSRWGAPNVQNTENRIQKTEYRKLNTETSRSYVQTSYILSTFYLLLPPLPTVQTDTNTRWSHHQCTNSPSSSTSYTYTELQADPARNGRNHSCIFIHTYQHSFKYFHSNTNISRYILTCIHHINDSCRKWTRKFNCLKKREIKIVLANVEPWLEHTPGVLLFIRGRHDTPLSILWTVWQRRRVEEWTNKDSLKREDDYLRKKWNQPGHKRQVVWREEVSCIWLVYVHVSCSVCGYTVLN